MSRRPEFCIPFLERLAEQQKAKQPFHFMASRGRVSTWRSDFYAPDHEQRRRDRAAIDKRNRRIDRNMLEQARLGNPPYGMDLMKDGTWQVSCCSCGRNYEMPCSPHEFDPDYSYCNRYGCTP